MKNGKYVGKNENEYDNKQYSGSCAYFSLLYIIKYLIINLDKNRRGYNKYINILPPEMDIKRINRMCRTIFGIDIIPMYSERNIFDKKSILITEFCSNGFFWAQFEDELV